MGWVESESNATPQAGSSRQPWVTMAECVQDAAGSREMFEEIRVWRRLDAHRMRLYRCLKHRHSGRYAVQGKEVIYVPHDAGRGAMHVGTPHLITPHFLTLGARTAPSDHCSWHDTLDAAIEASDA